jgi:tetratricopeptide (TPR) repeat protein
VEAELAANLAAAGRLVEARERFDALLSELTGPTRMSALLQRARVLDQLGEGDAALADLQEAFEGDPCAVIDALDERLAAVQSAARDTDAERAWVVTRVENLRRADRPAVLRHVLLDWTDRQRKDVELLRVLRDAETDAAEWEALTKTCGRLVALESGPEQVTAALRLSFACEKLGRPEDARRGLEHARRKQPDDPDLRRELMRVYEATGAGSELAALLLEGVEAAASDGERVALLERVVRLYRDAGSTAEAAAAMERIHALRPTDVSVVFSLVEVYVEADTLDRAQVVLDRATAALKGRRSPEMAELQRAQGRVAAARGDLAAQLDWLSQALTTDGKNLVIASEVALLAEAREEWETAIRALRTLTMAEGVTPMSKAEAYARQGRIALRRGDRQRAVLWARKAKSEDPEDGVTRDLLGQLGEV